jgi:hypothetical protein
MGSKPPRKQDWSMISAVLKTRAAAAFSSAILAGAGLANPSVWNFERPTTDFDKSSADFDDILSGGPPKEGVLPIDRSRHIGLGEVDEFRDFEIEATEPVVGIAINGEMRAYPLSILMWLEIVNDELGGVPTSVTFCPLYNAAAVFDRRLDDKVLDFGTSGKLWHSDLVMYNRQTESLWKQFLSQAVAGKVLGKRLTVLQSWLESWANFQARASDSATILAPTNALLHRYGANPYNAYESSSTPFLYRGEALRTLKEVDVAPLARVITVDLRGVGQ